MDTTYDKPDTLIGALLPPLDLARSAGLVVGFSLLTALAAQIVIPIGPVPITAQTFAVLLTGALLGRKLGALAMAAYLVEGVAGLPFFFGGTGGILHLLGPTGGYLVAFPAAAYITGAFAEQGWDKRFLTAAAAMAVGSIVILLSGWGGLAGYAMLTHSSTGLAFLNGVVKFIPGDIVKILLAAAALPTGWALLKRKASGPSS
jgi:biotin transporter BioY